jgi:hypothetical protein
MVPILLGTFVLVFLWWLGRNFSQANPAVIAALLRRAGGVAALAGAAFLILRGRIDMAVALGGFGAWLLGMRGFAIPGWSQRTQPSQGSRSTVRSAMLEMTLDHDTGRLEGQVLAGEFEGRALDALDEAQLDRLADLCSSSDPEGLKLLDAYLDRRFPGRREAAQGDTDAGTGRPRPGTMTEEEAYQVLGLDPGAGPEDIRRAHRELMKKLHPDQGGSTYLATRVNLAKDILLNRHR